MIPAIAVVILNWNGERFLRTFLPSVVQHSGFMGTRIVVADNGSSDGSIAFLHKEYPDVQTIELGKNYGFAEGYCRALSQIQATYYVLLNSDVEVTPNWLEPLYKAMEEDPHLGACMPKLLSLSHRDHFEYAGASGGFIDRFGYPFCRGRILNEIEKDEGQYDDRRPVFWASGACMFVRAAAYRKVGGLDGAFFAHMEEIDLCWRLHRADYSVAVMPQSVVFHLGGGTLPNNNPFKLYLNYRNSLFLLFKNLPLSGLVPVMFARMVLDGMSAAVYLVNGQIKNVAAVIRAHCAFYRHIPALITSRRSLKRFSVSKHHKEIYRGSIVFDFYFRRKKHFNALHFQSRH